MSGASRASGPGLPWLAAALILGLAAHPVAAQEDFRHVDEGRPVRVEDAYPVKFREWEWQLGALGSLASGGRGTAAGTFELKIGAAPNFQLGVEGLGGWERGFAGDASGLEGLALHALYNLNQEGQRTPAIALRTDLLLPGTGDLGRAEAGARIKLMATRSLGSSRLHLNVARSSAGHDEPGSAWSGGIALDRPLGLSSRAIVADIFFEAPDGAESARVWLDGGLRLQISKRSVLDLGVTTRLDEWLDGRENVGFVVGISRAFGLSGLATVPAYPNPELR